MKIDANEKKRRAAQAAIASLQEGMLLGVGTGSTVNHFIDALAAWRARLRGVVSSSHASTARLRAVGIEAMDLNDAGTLDLCVDGADEANPMRQLIKGGGGALTREKIVAGASSQFICIVDEAKLVQRLGKFPLPVEVIPMARTYVAGQLPGRPVWREGFITDNANVILDIHDLSIDDAATLERDISLIAGVVTVGLFALRPADLLLIGTDQGVQHI